MQVLARTIRQAKEIKGIKTGKEEAKLLFLDDMFLYIENPKDATKKTVRIDKFKVAKYKVNKQQSLAFLYMSNEQSKEERTKIIPFI